jgi:glycosyltransferase involved in cell wall biosynthesis
MNVGIVTYYTQNAWDSLDHVLRSTAAALGEAHHIEPYPPEYPLASAARQRELLASWLDRCDVAVGPVDDRVLGARESLDRHVPYVCFLMGSLSRGAVRIGGTYERLRTSDILVGNCTADAVLCEKLFPGATARVVPFGIDTTLFQPQGAAVTQEARRRLGIGPHEKVLLYAGRLSLEKNLHTLLNVFSVVRAAVPDVRLVIAGPERNVPFVEFGVFTLGIKPSLQRLAASLGLDARSVLFVGQRTPEEMRALYSLADVAVNLTLHHDENFGFAQIEAMACGTPVVGTAVGGIKTTVVDGETGYLVPPSDPDALSERLAWLQRHPQLAQRMGWAGMRRAYQHFTWRNVATQLANVYENAIESVAGYDTQPLVASGEMSLRS